MPRYRIKYNNQNQLYYFQYRVFLWWSNVKNEQEIRSKLIRNANLYLCKKEATRWIELNEWSN